MAPSETDYLVMGAGAVGLAFVDTLLDEDPDCHVTIVDRHAAPGGHWNDAYSFVRLHQPSANYGVVSMELGEDRVDTAGHNAGMHPLAGRAEILAYFDKVMHGKLLPSGRVAYHRLADCLPGKGRVHHIRGILSGEEQEITVRRRLVDGTAFQTSVPSTHTPAFAVEEGARLAIPGDLPRLWQHRTALPDRYVILGGGKTAMDTAVWLIEAGVPPERIGWVRPRDSWMFNRRYVQPGVDGILDVLTFQRALVEAAAGSQSGSEMMAKLGEGGFMLRIDPEVMPRMMHFAVISEGEIALMRRIAQVYRQGRVTRIAPGRMDFAEESVALPENTLFIDCTATAVPFGGARLRPFFEEGRITLQCATSPLVVYSAALAAFLEANFNDDAERNALCPPTPLTDCPDTYPYAVMANLMANGIHAGNAKISAFNRRCRLHLGAPAIAALTAQGHPGLAAFADLGEVIRTNMPGVMRLGMQAREIHERSFANGHEMQR
ncbi:MAG: hypothetical protein GC147_03915 [Porphyrobacter sp.]|nr:hypothetical protein [Porphyrobacter sp.]